MKIDATSYLSHSKNFRQRFLILHYTAGDFAFSINALTQHNVSAHYVVPTLKTIDPTYLNDELIVYCLVAEQERAWHAGVSAWQDRTNLNDSSIGIEIVNQATDTQFEPYPDEQIQLVIGLCKNILARYPDIVPTNVLGHSDIAVGRKIDPGPLFPWKMLYDNGIGAWYDQDTIKYYQQRFDEKMPTIGEVVGKLNDYGYRHQADHLPLIKTFQMHFRQSNYSGKLDAETAAIAYALVDKYG